MSDMTGSTKVSWHPDMDVDTTTTAYWFNWRVLLCAIWVIIPMTFASFLIWKYEGFRESNRGSSRETEKEAPGALFDDETWRPCLKGVHPAWLLSFRVIAFFVLMLLLVVTAFVDGGSIFYYYTQWTCTLITVYFGLGSLLSIYGCYQYQKRLCGEKVGNLEMDAENGTYVASAQGENSNNAAKVTNTDEEAHVRQRAGFWGYAFQIIFQMSAGAVLLTDCVFWFIIVPFLEINNYGLNIVSIILYIASSIQLIINMHTINAVFLLGDASLNCLRFPIFRVAYFYLWTVTYVIVQWIVHACVKLWWPYPFLDLSSSYAPLWYFSVAVMHIPCYGAFALTIKVKHYLLSRWFKNSYLCAM
ncbi:hypothetical protein Pint_15462 [Pistacia integerrima]|uniref:Uncharacterized protein n=1 Tax=Pistacia integerrima TaxID=434235 RepID=A0ACC0ZAM4_9ROSI|nr:hypothetical protein Pint_15462 [Pistacia integerrima]